MSYSKNHNQAIRLSCIIISIFIFAIILMPAALATDKAQENVSYIALGDSFSSGFGVEPYQTGDDCKRSIYAYPKIIARELKMDLSFNACSGATTDDLLSEQTVTQNTRSNGLNKDTKLVTLTIGGNDIGFSSIAAKLIYGFSENFNEIKDVEDKIKALDGEIELPGIISYDNIFKAIKKKAPNATIIAIGYPRLYSETENCNEALSQTNRKLINKMTADLNAVIKSNALKNNIIFIAPEFDKHELCSSNNDWIYPPFTKDTATIQPGALHPTQAGQKAIAEAVIKTIKSSKITSALIDKNNDTANNIKTQFAKIYKRNFNTDSIYDKNAIAIMTDGIKSAKRNFFKEIRSIKTFVNVYKQLPLTAFDWKIVQAIAYSGAKR